MPTATWTHQLTDDFKVSTTSNQASWTLTAGTVGDVRVLHILTESSTVSVSSLSGGGVTTWTQAGSANTVSSSDFGVASKAQIFYGRVTSTGTALTITYSASIGTSIVQSYRQDFRSSNGGVNVSLAASGFIQTSNTTSSSPMTWPSLTTTRAGQLVTGVAWDNGPTGGSLTGSTTGYTYTADTNVNYHVYRLVTANSETEAPTMTFTGTNGWASMLAILDDDMISVADTATGTDVANSLLSGISDTGAGADLASIKQGNQSDSGAGLDTASLKLSGIADSGTGAETSNLALSGISDSAAGTDLGSIKQGDQPDSAAGTESASLKLTGVADTGAGTDAMPGVKATVPGADTGAGVDLGIVNLHGARLSGPRVYTVAAEDRTFAVPEDSILVAGNFLYNRDYVVAPEIRVYEVPEDPDVQQ